MKLASDPIPPYSTHTQPDNVELAPAHVSGRIGKQDSTVSSMSKMFHVDHFT